MAAPNRSLELWLTKAEHFRFGCACLQNGNLVVVLDVGLVVARNTLEDTVELGPLDCGGLNLDLNGSVKPGVIAVMDSE